MFKKLVRNMPFSPGLVDQVGFYVKRLRQEEFIRRIGLIFTALSVAVQVVSIAIPPTHAQTDHPNNMVYGGVPSKAAMLNVWDNGDTNGNTDIDDIFLHFGITRNDIEEATLETMRSTDEFKGEEVYSIGRNAYGKPDEQKIIVEHTDSDETSSVYVRPWARSWGVYSTEVLRGVTVSGRDFAVIMNCGNLVIALEDIPPPLPVKGDFSVSCEAITGWAYDPRLENSVLNVRIAIDGTPVKTVAAGQPNSFVNGLGIPGPHGFSWDVPATYLDGENHPVSITIEEDVAARGGLSEGNTVMTSSTGADYVPADCYEEPEPEYTLVCRPGEGVVRILVGTVNPTDFADPSMCDFVPVCLEVDGVYFQTELERYQYDGEPAQCPTIQVCDLDSGVVIPITADLYDSSLHSEDAADCDDMQVCEIDSGELTTIKQKDYDEDDHFQPYTDSFGNATCLQPSAEIGRSKLARNLTQDIASADGTTAKPGDRILYQLTTVNTGTLDGETDVEEDIVDILEYSTLVNDGGAEFNSETGQLTWAGVEIPAGQNVVHSFEVEVDATLPSTATSEANPGSYDFEMTNFYGNAVNIKLPEPLTKEIEKFAGNLPETGPAQNAFFISLFVVLVVYFYFRNRLITKELKLIRRDYVGA